MREPPFAEFYNYQYDIQVKCPHCLVAVYTEFQRNPIALDKDGGWVVLWMKCPACDRIVMYIENGIGFNAGGIFAGLMEVSRVQMFYPKGTSRMPCPEGVPVDFVDDYKEACVVLADSSKASAALSRRCLQHFLREVVKVHPADLFNEIQETLNLKMLPSGIADALDAVRAIGNFAAHPMKSKNTGEVMPVEPGEAEWNLDVLESLFDFYFVQPRILQEKKDALNKKLAEVGKPPLK